MFPLGVLFQIAPPPQASDFQQNLISRYFCFRILVLEDIQEFFAQDFFFFLKVPLDLVRVSRREREAYPEFSETTCVAPKTRKLVPTEKEKKGLSFFKNEVFAGEEFGGELVAVTRE